MITLGNPAQAQNRWTLFGPVPDSEEEWGGSFKPVESAAHLCTTFRITGGLYAPRAQAFGDSDRKGLLRTLLHSDCDFLVLRCCWRKRWPGAAQGGGQALRDSVLKGLLRTLLHSDSGFPTLRWRWRKCWPGAAQGGGAGWAIDLVVRLHRRAEPAPPFFFLKTIENGGGLCLCFLQGAP